MQLTLLKGYPDRIGKRFSFCGYGVGPKSYVQKTSSPIGGGDVISPFAFQNYIDLMNPAMSMSGTYIVYPFTTQSGPRGTWALMWVTRTTGVEVTAAVDLSAETVQLGGLGGVY